MLTLTVAFVGSKFDGETTRVTSAVMRARFATNCGESYADRALLAGLENIGHAEVIHRVGSLVIAMSTASLGVHNTLWDAFAVEVRKEVNQVEVLEEERAVLANSLSLIWMRHWRAVGRGVESLCGRCIAVIVIVAVDVAGLATT